MYLCVAVAVVTGVVVVDGVAVVAVVVVVVVHAQGWARISISDVGLCSYCCDEKSSS